MTELIEKIGGIGALIISPQKDKFLTIEELRTKRSTHKLAGQRSLPMETIIPGETREQTVHRLNQEEIQIVDFDLWEAHWGRLGDIEIAEAVVLHAIFFELPRDLKISLGSEVTEINSPEWVSLKEIMDEPKDSLHFRPGVFETVHLYDDYRRFSQFIPGILRFTDLRNRIPSGVFDLVEGGISVEEALFQLELEWRPKQPEVGLQVLGRPQLVQGSP